MKHIFFPIFIISCFTAFCLLEGCSSKAPVKEYEITVVINDKIEAKKGAKNYVQDINSICSNIVACSEEANFIPKPTLLRLGVEDAEYFLGDTSKISWADPNNVNYLQKRINKSVNKTLPDKFLVANPENVDIYGMLKSYLFSISGTPILYYSNQKGMNAWENHHVYHSLDSIKFAVQSLVCDSNKYSFVIVYNPIPSMNTSSNYSEQTYKKLNFISPEEMEKEITKVVLDLNNYLNSVAQKHPDPQKLKELALSLFVENGRDSKVEIQNRGDVSARAIAAYDYVNRLQSGPKSSLKWDINKIYLDDMPGAITEGLHSAIVTQVYLSESYTDEMQKKIEVVWTSEKFTDSEGRQGEKYVAKIKNIKVVQAPK